MKRRNKGKKGGRRGEAHNAMGQGGWTDSICSQLSAALGNAGEWERQGEQKEGGRISRKKEREDTGQRE